MRSNATKNLLSEKLLLEELSWHAVEAEIGAVNSRFAELIRKLNPPKSLTVFKARYPYGAKILEDGVFNLPLLHGGTISIDSPKIPAEIKKRLSYNPLPISLVLKNTCEVYAKSDNHCMPIRICKPGETFGTWEIFDSKPFKLAISGWDISSGARSVLMLPKTAIFSAHNKLRTKYEFNLPPPKSLIDQHNIFTKLAQHHLFPEEWENIVLFFPKEWLEQEKGFSSIWKFFNYYLLKEAWHQTLFLRNHIGISLIWRALAAEMEKMTAKPRNYIVETIKKLIMIGLGTDPAFAPATNSLSVPINGLQKVYMEDYKIGYLPTIMEASYLNANNNLPVYYSLQYPTLLQYPSIYDNSRSAMQDCEIIKQLIDALQEKLKKDNPREYELTKHLQFDYYHTEKDSFRVMNLPNNLVQKDARFCYSSLKNNQLEFAYNASFLRGCIKLSLIK
ncbi:MAG: hypothetical protein M1561_00515 [Gammaproteobacteria bacterium]|nr:hypothetical protein [Gammaproteobacteria bacterium]